MLTYGLLAGGLLLLWLVVPAVSRALLLRRRREMLARLGTFLGDTHDHDQAAAWGRDLGVHTSVRFRESTAGDGTRRVWTSSRWTEVTAELGATYPLVIDLVRRRWPWTRRGAAGHWDPRWEVVAAPSDVAQRLIDAGTQAELHRLGVTELRLGVDITPQFTLIVREWLLDFEQAQQVLQLAASLATRVAEAFAAAEAATQAALRNEMFGAAYRGDPAASQAQRAADHRSTELAMAHEALARRQRRERWTSALFVVGLAASAVGLTVLALRSSAVKEAAIMVVAVILLFQWLKGG